VEPAKKRAKAAPKKDAKKAKATKSSTKKTKSSASESEDGNMSDSSSVSSSSAKKTRFEIDEGDQDVFEFQETSITDIILANPPATVTPAEDESIVVIPKGRGGKKRANVIEDSFEKEEVSVLKEEVKPRHGGGRKKNEADESILDESMSVEPVKPKRGRKKKAATENVGDDASVLDESMVSVADESMASIVGETEEVKPKRITRKKKNEADVSVVVEPVKSKRGGKKKGEDVKGVEDAASILDESMISVADDTIVSVVDETEEVKPTVKPKRGGKKKAATENVGDDASVLDESMVSVADESMASIVGETEEVKPKRNTRKKKNETDESMSVETVKPKRGGKKKKVDVQAVEDAASILDESMGSNADETEEVKPKRGGRRKKNEADESILDESVSVEPVKPKRGGKKKKKVDVEDESILDDSMISVAESTASTTSGDEAVSKPRAARNKKPVVRVPVKEAGRRNKRGEDQAESSQASPDVEEEKEQEIFEDAADRTIMIDDIEMEAPVTAQKVTRAVDVIQVDEEVVQDEDVDMHLPVDDAQEEDLQGLGVAAADVDEKENNPDRFEKLMANLESSKISLSSLPSQEDILLLLSDGRMGSLDGGVLSDEQLYGNYLAAGEHYMREQMKGIKEKFSEAAQACVEYLEGYGN
jgi:hypothetical protein